MAIEVEGLRSKRRSDKRVFGLQYPGQDLGQVIFGVVQAPRSASSAATIASGETKVVFDWSYNNLAVAATVDGRAVTKALR